jgi:hypothetical protein
MTKLEHNGRPAFGGSEIAFAICRCGKFAVRLAAAEQLKWTIPQPAGRPMRDCHGVLQVFVTERKDANG